MAKYDLLLQGANAYFGKGKLKTNVDIAIKQGTIQEVSPFIPGNSADRTIDVRGKLVSPAFMDTHMHIDESFTMDDDNTLSLLAAIDNQEKSNAKYYGWTDAQLVGMMVTNAERVIKMCIKNGTQLLKTNVLFTPAWGTNALTAMTILREKYKDIFDLRTCCGVSPRFREEIERRAKDGEVDFISGYPYMDEDYWATVDRIFDSADRLGLPVDVHTGESNVPDMSCLMYTMEQAKKYSMQGRITCGHVTSLSSIGATEKEVAAAIDMARDIKLNVTSLTSCNLYLSSTNRRGPTLVHNFLDAGVNVAIASDNIRDTFRPYGNCNLLEEALLTAKVHQMSSDAELRTVFDMITYNGAINALVPDYGMENRNAASLVVLDAPTPEDAILSKAKVLHYFKNGKEVAL